GQSARGSRPRRDERDASAREPDPHGDLPAPLPVPDPGQPERDVGPPPIRNRPPRPRARRNGLLGGTQAGGGPPRPALPGGPARVPPEGWGADDSQRPGCGREP